MKPAKNWQRATSDAPRERDNARAQLAYEQAQRRQWQADYMAEHREHLDQTEAERDELLAIVKAVRELHQQSALIRYVPRSMRQGHDDDQPFHYCTGCDGARYPCDTIRALEGSPHGHSQQHG